MKLTFFFILIFNYDEFRQIHFFNFLLTGNWGVFFSFNVWNSSTRFNFLVFFGWPSGSLVLSCCTFFNSTGPRLEWRRKTDCYTNEKSLKFSFFYLKSSFSSFRTPSNCGVFTACRFFGWTRPCIGGGGGGGGIAEDAMSLLFIIFNSFVRLLSKFSMVFSFAFISNNSSLTVASTKAYEIKRNKKNTQNVCECSYDRGCEWMNKTIITSWFFRRFEDGPCSAVSSIFLFNCDRLRLSNSKIKSGQDKSSSSTHLLHLTKKNFLPFSILTFKIFSTK